MDFVSSAALRNVQIDKNTAFFIMKNKRQGFTEQEYNPSDSWQSGPSLNSSHT